MPKTSLSLCLIVKNEETNLPRVLKSVEGCVDEICVTDTGSTDRTVEVAKAHGCKVSYFDWVNDFSAARNFNFSQATCDYTLWLDADDVLERPDKFQLFKNTAMGLADYWMANYHYTSDPHGKPLCTFARERVIKNGLGMKWTYPIHEGVTPVGDRDIRAQFTPAWAVRHLRTEEDIAQDKGRNLRVFEAMKPGTMDARMKYYYGKELFESGKPVESVGPFSEALSDTKLELHDRLLATQYCCYAYFYTDQFERAVALAHQGLMLDPQRGEFYTIIGDAYIKMNQLQRAMPFFEAAKRCVYDPSNHNAPSAVFKNEDAYTSYPMLQLTRIHVHSGQLDKAESEALECETKFNHPEAKALLTEVRKIKFQSTSFKYASKEVPDIVFSTAPMTAYEFDPGKYKEKAMGGSETALIEMAHWLKKISGRPVKVFNMREKDGVWGGVEYISNQKVHDYFSVNKPALHVAWRHNLKLTNAPTVVWCHDLITPGAEAIDQYDKILTLTPFHKNYLMTMQGIPEDKIHLTRNGICPERFAESLPKEPYRFVFGSSPDRGLDRAMRVLDKVREKYPEVTLHVHYGIEHLPRWGHQALHDRLKVMLDERKEWVIYHGATEQTKLMESYKRSSYLIQPSDWIETSCISAMELLACGVYPIFRKVGGVADTLSDAEKAGMATLVDSDCITEKEHQIYVDATLEAISENRVSRVKIDPENLSWKRVAEEWLRDLPGLAGSNGQPG